VSGKQDHFKIHNKRKSIFKANAKLPKNWSKQGIKTSNVI